MLKQILTGVLLLLIHTARSEEKRLLLVGRYEGEHGLQRIFDSLGGQPLLVYNDLVYQIDIECFLRNVGGNSNDRSIATDRNKRRKGEDENDRDLANEENLRKIRDDNNKREITDEENRRKSDEEENKRRKADKENERGLKEDQNRRTEGVSENQRERSGRNANRTVGNAESHREVNTDETIRNAAQEENKRKKNGEENDRRKASLEMYFLCDVNTAGKTIIYFHNVSDPEHLSMYNGHLIAAKKSKLIFIQL